MADLTKTIYDKPKRGLFNVSYYHLDEDVITKEYDIIAEDETIYYYSLGGVNIGVNKQRFIKWLDTQLSLFE